MLAGNDCATVQRPALVEHGRPRIAQQAVSLIAQPMPAPVQPLEGVLNHVLGRSQVANHQQREPHEFQVMFAEQGRDNVSGMLAIGPGRLTRAIGRVRRFTLHS